MLTSESDCLVCQKHWGIIPIPGGPIFENDLIFISHALLYKEEREHYLGHIFIETKRHIAELSQLTQDETQIIGIYRQRIAQAMMDTLGMVHIYAFVIGDGVPHFHEHVIGRYPNTPREFWGVKVDEWVQVPHGGKEEIAKINILMRDYLNRNFE